MSDTSSFVLAPPKKEHPHKASIRTGLRRHLLIGGLAFCTLVFGLGGMAATLSFSSAVVTGGRLVVSSNVKRVQHVEGGTVVEINVKDGDHVEAGDILVRLDPTMAAANLAIVSKGLDEELARRARLQAERSGATELTFPDALTSRESVPEVAEAMSIEKRAFELRLAARDGQKEQLRKKIAELEQQLVGVKAQEDAVTRQIDLTTDEVKGLRELRDKDLVGTDRMVDAERRLAQLEGQHGQLVASAAQIGAEVAQAELQILQIDQDVRSEVSRELADAGSKINELTERKIAAEDQLKRLDIRAPISGTVYQVAVHTVGGVIARGEQIMLVVPEKDLLVVEAPVKPREVDRVHPQQEAVLRFTGFGSRNTPEYEGKVETVSPDVVIDERTGQGYYRVRVTVPQKALDDLGAKLVPGMPVEVFISTGDRTVLSYLVRPLGDQIMHTFRER
ncbi:MAG: HlyD family type I secretion periplasmic adaptor subunit [Bauldia sp.]|uniref:HlyD family type I secretion periplasmic adaptor subunit n=1 Tax=Bauldia sp. TaxID=2575872 RepID=UPI001D5B824B|nr:HlyD family type I secretion periplasmic adaptor subunit [Bauldia sp.]MCB1497248.1 HlyD family type I secretion periplasmic adaptor subunit [Bauldia sp.]